MRRGFRSRVSSHSGVHDGGSVADKHMWLTLLHGDERKVWGDGAYQGQSETIREAAPHAQDMTSRRTRYKKLCGRATTREDRVKARVRAEGGASLPDSEASLRV